MPNYAPFAPFMTILRSMNVCSMTVKSVSRRWQERGADNRPTSDKSTAASAHAKDLYIAVAGVESEMPMHTMRPT